MILARRAADKTPTGKTMKIAIRWPSAQAIRNWAPVDSKGSLPIEPGMLLAALEAECPMADESWTGAEELLRDWLQRARESQHSHHEAGKFCRSANYWLAVPVIILTAVLGTSAFASVANAVSGTAKVYFGTLSMLAAVLTALQTHFRYAERGERHKNLGAQYGSIRREIETVLSLQPSHRGEPSTVLDHIREKMDAISAEGDVVSRRIFERTRRRLARKDAARGTELSRQ